MTYYKKAWAVFRQNWRLIVPLVIAASLLSSGLFCLQLPLKWIPMPEDEGMADWIDFFRIIYLPLALIATFPVDMLFPCFYIMCKCYNEDKIVTFACLIEMLKPRMTDVLKTFGSIIACVCVLIGGAIAVVAIVAAIRNVFDTFGMFLMLVLGLPAIIIMFVSDSASILVVLFSPLIYLDVVQDKERGLVSVEHTVHRLFFKGFPDGLMFVGVQTPAFIVNILVIGVTRMLRLSNFEISPHELVFFTFAAEIVALIPCISTCFAWSERRESYKPKKKNPYRRKR